MFDVLNEFAKETGKVIGHVTGPIMGVPYDIIAETLGITETAVKHAIKEGCFSYQEIREFYNLK